MGLTQQETELIFDKCIEILSDHLANDEGFSLPKMVVFPLVSERAIKHTILITKMIGAQEKSSAVTQSSTLKTELNND